LERFREMIEICRTMALSYRDGCREAERTREEFDRQLAKKYRRDTARIRREPRLQRRESGPPCDGYTWQEFHVREKREADGRTYEVPCPLSGWVKVRDTQDFVRPKFDPARSPLVREEWEPQPRHHGPGDLLYGYYWLLAAIHDKFYAKRFLIIEEDQRQWPVDMLQHLWFAKDMASSRLTAFEVKTALREVKADFKRLTAKRPELSSPGASLATGLDSIADVSPSPAHCSHSDGFTSCVWYGRQFQFSKRQAECISMLWKAWEAGTPTLSQMTIGDRVGSAAVNFRLDKTFRNHPAWGVMIQQAGRGIYKLAKPPTES